MSYRRAGLLTLLAAAIGICAGVARAQTATPRTLHVAYLRSLSYSPLFLAMEKGYLKEAGIDLDLQMVQSASDVIAFLARGQIDISFGNVAVPFFNAASRGLDLRLIGSLSYAPTSPDAPSPNPIIISKTRSGSLHSVADLKGLKLAINTRGGIIEYQFAEALKHAHLNIDDVHFVTIPFPDMVTALANGAVDAAIVPEPIATSAIEKGVVSVLDTNPAPGAMLTTTIIGHTLMADGEKKTVDGFLHALRRAAAEIPTPEAIMAPANLAVWAHYTALPEALIAKTRPYVFDKDLAIDKDDVLRQQQFLVETKQIDQALPIEQFVDTRYAIIR